ncbi:hypothetical protein DYB26_008074 [Aphanomyces astaci]|uniref:Carboxypeptidase n=1 Tax=Aphanomyces astaci TaxID=112090 RepID=A0A397C422_APHAT|nr:hypothetical protein DYB38_001918 [Aphanomyces astaci]RHZ33970.1 hypothetical protein DYB26_008074 [Aphanomyces astaci]
MASSRRRVQVLNATSDVLPAVGLEGLRSPHHTGYINVDYTNDGDIFYWHFDADPDDASESSATLPLVIWLQGGPGCSSLIGLFLECGPFRMHDDGSVAPNPHGWHKAANVLFVDQPVGTGMSRVQHDAYPTSGDQVAAHFYLFLVEFLKQHPQYLRGDSTRPIFLFGESHAGRWIPQFHTYIARQNAKQSPSSFHIHIEGVGIGNGWIHPHVQYDYSAFAHGLGLISHAQRRSLELDCQAAIDAGNMNTPECFRNLDSIVASVQGGTSRLNVFDVRLYGDAALYPAQKPLLTTFLNRPDVRTAMASVEKSQLAKGTPHEFAECNAYVNRNLAGEDAVSTLADVNAMLANGVRVLLYNGQWDMMCNALNTELLVEQLTWVGRTTYVGARRFTWRLGSGRVPAGFVQSGGNLTSIVVRDAGHLVPYDAPEAALDMVKRFIHSRSFEDIEQQVANQDDGPSQRCQSRQSDDGSSSHVTMVVAVASGVVAALLTWLLMRPQVVAVKRTHDEECGGEDSSSDDDDDDGVEEDLMQGHVELTRKETAASRTRKTIDIA